MVFHCCCRGCISKWHGNEKGRALNEPEIHFVVDFILKWIERRLLRIAITLMNDCHGRKKRGEPAIILTTCSPSPYSLLQPLEEHAGRLKRDNFDFLDTFDASNSSSWFSSQPKDESLKLKAVQSL